MSNGIIEQIKQIHSSDKISSKKHYAVIFKSYKNAVWQDKISFGYSRVETKNFMCSTHAEVDAIDKIKHWRNMPKSVDLFVIRLSKDGCIGESKPCKHCILLIKKAKINIKYIYCSNSNGKIIKLRIGEYEPCICSGMRTWKKK